MTRLVGAELYPGKQESSLAIEELDPGAEADLKAWAGRERAAPMRQIRIGVIAVRPEQSALYGLPPSGGRAFAPARLSFNQKQRVTTELPTRVEVQV
jgi:hypothetical protein